PLCRRPTTMSSIERTRLAEQVAGHQHAQRGARPQPLGGKTDRMVTNEHCPPRATLVRDSKANHKLVTKIILKGGGSDGHSFDRSAEARLGKLPGGAEPP